MPPLVTEIPNGSTSTYCAGSSYDCNRQYTVLSSFSGCAALTSITFAAGSKLHTIGASAFFGASALTSLVLPAGLTTLRSFSASNGYHGAVSDYRGAFHGLSALTSLELPASVTAIPEGRSVSKLTYGHDNNRVGFSGMTNTFSGCSSLVHLSFGNSSALTSIGSWGFASLLALKSLSFGTGSALTSVGRNAFSGTTALESVVVPANVSSMGFRAFDGCKKLSRSL